MERPSPAPRCDLAIGARGLLEGQLARHRDHAAELRIEPLEPRQVHLGQLHRTHRLAAQQVGQLPHRLEGELVEVTGNVRSSRGRRRLDHRDRAGRWPGPADRDRIEVMRRRHAVGERDRAQPRVALPQSIHLPQHLLALRLGVLEPEQLLGLLDDLLGDLPLASLPQRRGGGAETPRTPTPARNERRAWCFRGSGTLMVTALRSGQRRPRPRGRVGGQHSNRATGSIAAPPSASRQRSRSREATATCRRQPRSRPHAAARCDARRS